MTDDLGIDMNTNIGTVIQFSGHFCVKVDYNKTVDFEEVSTFFETTVKPRILRVRSSYENLVEIERSSERIWCQIWSSAATNNYIQYSW